MQCKGDELIRFNVGARYKTVIDDDLSSLIERINFFRELRDNNNLIKLLCDDHGSNTFSYHNHHNTYVLCLLSYFNVIYLIFNANFRENKRSKLLLV